MVGDTYARSVPLCLFSHCAARPWRVQVGATGDWGGYTKLSRLVRALFLFFMGRFTAVIMHRERVLHKESRLFNSTQLCLRESISLCVHALNATLAIFSLLMFRGAGLHPHQLHPPEGIQHPPRLPCFPQEGLLNMTKHNADSIHTHN